jgi:hypothetical protein
MQSVYIPSFFHKKTKMSRRTAQKKTSSYVVAIDLDHTALISNDLGGLRSAIDMDALSDADALALIRRVTNPRLLEAVQALRKQKRVDRLVFYTAKGGLLRDLVVGTPADLWLTPRTLRFRAAPASRTYLYEQLCCPPTSAAGSSIRNDFVGLGVLTWGLSLLLGLSECAAPVYLTDEPKNPDLIAHDLDVPRVVLFDDQADYYAAQLGAPPQRGLFRAVEPFDYPCLSPAQARDLEAFLQARCGPPLADCDVSSGSAWRVTALNAPLPPWFIADL